MKAPNGKYEPALVKPFRVPTSGKKDNYWAYPVVHRSHGGVVVHEAVDSPDMFSVSHEETGFSLLRAVARSVADSFFDDVCVWPEWEAIHSKGDAQFLRTRINHARDCAMEAA